MIACSFIVKGKDWISKRQEFSVSAEAIQSMMKLSTREKVVVGNNKREHDQ